ncbi:Guanine nucleotide-binding protein alpha-12 subunit [Reticulomyxa filosa]|uniref:Guanine nucleotide-binding protein alpha-12 subunit n=1 Tax=Reticulomyxa filosa TaxID=46433 RepID=X6NFP1_RETFI|nr:Guanine nucleotide-binding protein alpha-12 subunit [Reticulomyxa filosa]|eukprot:ETO25140.1 Guanine nucleotide-binding protein alpha-12 subunit [Reticulomyxa filosa]
MLRKGDFFNEKTLILFFNKHVFFFFFFPSLFGRFFLCILLKDLFVEKIKTVPISKSFTDWPNDKDSTDQKEVLDFLFAKFDNVLKKCKVVTLSSLFKHVTTALDTDMMNKIFESISNDLIKQNLKAAGVL